VFIFFGELGQGHNLVWGVAVKHAGAVRREEGEGEEKRRLLIWEGKGGGRGRGR
jgi:hypothetical protein